MSEQDIKKDTVTVEIDGKTYQAPKNAKLIEITDREGIYIPRFCYHNKLSVAANCRMCLVEVEGARRPCAACATPVMEGMKVHTKSKLTRDYQKSVMEFLLINHPLDCPICDQGGECELQDLSVGYGQDTSQYTQGKRVVPKKDIGPLVETDLTRCIQCTRCVRFGEEIVGEQELGLVNRGEHEEIDTFLGHGLNNEVSGNVIDLCPVGALTNKPFRYRARAWELRQHPLVSPHDCVGSHLYGHVRRGDMLRIVPRANESINEVWATDRDRYGMYGLESEDRLTQPMIKTEGEWEPVSWEKALDTITKRLQRVQDQHGAESIAGLASANSTTEELYLFQKVLRGLGTHNIDHRVQQLDFDWQDIEATYPGLDCEITAIEKADAVLLLGSNIRAEQPIINLKLRKAALKGAAIYVMNPMDFDFHFDVKQAEIVDLEQMVIQLAGVVKTVLTQAKNAAGLQKDTSQFFKAIKVDANAKQMAERLLSAKNPMILVGAVANSHPQASLIRSLIVILKQALNAKGGFLTYSANTSGAWLAGAVPHRGPAGEKMTQPGQNARAMLTSGIGLKAYVLLNLEPQYDSVFGQAAATQLRTAECVIALTPFAGKGLKEIADIMLPIATFNETSGTYVNVHGLWQSFTGASVPPGESKPAWKVLRVMANFLSLNGFEYDSTQAVLNELTAKTDRMKHVSAGWVLPEVLPEMLQTGLTRIGLQALYATDNIVRRSQPLQQTALMKAQHDVVISSQLAKSLKVEQGDRVVVRQQHGDAVTLSVRINPSLPDNSVMLATGFQETAALGLALGPIELTKGPTE